MHYMIEDFIVDTNACLSRMEAFELYKEAISRLGFDSAVYTFITDHNGANQKAGHGIQSNYPEDWMKYYKSNGYEKIDPVVQHAFATASAFTWKDVEETRILSAAQKKLMREAKDAGLNAGVGIPLYGARGEIAGVGLANKTKDVMVDRSILSQIRFITEQFHLVYCLLETSKNTTHVPRLTPKELEILKWWAIGKTAEEVALILGSTGSNVRWHIRNIYEKLEANSRILAISKAIRLGIIQMDAINIF